VIGRRREKIPDRTGRGTGDGRRRGVWRNCSLNPYCDAPSMIDDPAAQVDVMLAYAARYGDLCPWNPGGDYRPGCGYK